MDDTGNEQIEKEEIGMPSPDPVSHLKYPYPSTHLPPVKRFCPEAVKRVKVSDQREEHGGVVPNSMDGWQRVTRRSARTPCDGGGGLAVAGCAGGRRGIHSLTSA